MNFQLRLGRRVGAFSPCRIAALVGTASLVAVCTPAAPMAMVTELLDHQPFEVGLTAWGAVPSCRFGRDFLVPGTAQCPETIRERDLAARAWSEAASSLQSANPSGANAALVALDLVWLRPGEEPRASLERLERAVKAAPENADTWNDLAAAYYIAARSTGRAQLLLSALEAVERAVGIDPGHEMGTFNRRVIHERLFLTEPVAAPVKVVDDPFARIEGEIWGAVSEAEISQLPALLETAAELAAESGDPGAERSVERARHLLLRAPGTRGRRLAIAFADFDEGRSAYYRYEIRAAREALARALEILTELDVPLRHSARLYLALCAFQDTDYDAAYVALERLTSELDYREHPNIVARALHTRGLLHTVRSEVFDALRLAQQEVDALAVVDDPVRMASNHLDLARLYRQVGDTESAWRYLYRAMEGAGRMAPIAAYGVWREAFEAAREEVPGTAKYFVSRFVESARRSDNPLVPASALRVAGTFFYEDGRVSEAMVAFDEAATLIAIVDNPVVREAMEVNLELSRTELLEDHQIGTVDLDRLGSYYERTGNLENLLRVDVARVRTLASAEDLAGLDATIQALTSRVAGRIAIVPDAALRSRYGRAIAKMLEATLSTQLATNVEPEGVLAAQERLRTSRWFGEYAGVSEEPRYLVRAGSGGRAVLMTLTALPGELVHMVIVDDRIEIRRTPQERDGLVARAAQFRRVLQEGDAPGAERIGRDLFEALLGPVWDLISDRYLLVLAPGDYLQGIPFGALENPSGGKILLETHLPVIVPSLTTYEVARRRLDERSARGEGHFVAVGFGAAAQVPIPLPALPGVETEIDAIREARPDATVVLGAEATADTVLASLSTARVFHFAGHAISRADEPRLSWIATAGSAPGEASPVTAADLARHRMPHLELVILSSCRTAGTHATGDGGLLGLAEAFLVAGAPAVIASLWDVADDVTSKLFVDFHRRLAAGHSPAEALRAAQLAASRPSDNRARFGWAAFQLVGAAGVEVD